jgi:hypothetical protein
MPDPPTYDGTEPWHGADTDIGYTNHKCRCPKCTDTHAAAIARFREAAKDKPLPPGVHPDSLTAYQYYGSRTPGALQSNRDRVNRQRAARKVNR